MSGALLLLDIDGVLNPHAAKPESRPAGYTTHRLRPAGWELARKPLRVWLSPAHGPLLCAFAAAHGVELAWATTWEHDANTMISPVIGLPELAVVEFDGHPGTLDGWKYPAVLAHADGRPVVWLDDDFRVPVFARAQATFLAARGDAPTLLYHVDPKVGLIAGDLVAVAKWLASLT